MNETNETEDKGKNKDDEQVHIFVNRRKFDLEKGVHVLTGAQIAALVDIPADQAVVKYDDGPKNGEEIEVSETVPVKNGDHFIATRKVVDGGYGA